jgi:hypothetical protein
VRSFLTTLALVSAGLMLTAEAWAGQSGAPRPRLPTIHMTDGPYATHDEKVICKSSRGWLGCENGGHAQILCVDGRCKPYWGLHVPTPADLEVRLEDEKAPKKQLPAHAVILASQKMACTVRPNRIECRMAGRRGGFQMDGIFARCSCHDTAPAGWPWDGRHPGEDETSPGS